jgi:phosphoglycolate phosphatase-like HAD superfamily hydrolase
MTELYLDQIPAKPEEAAHARRKFAWDEIMRLNGRPSIHQAARLVELVIERGGQPLEAIAYQADFQERLGACCTARLAIARADSAAANALLVPGVRAFFERIRMRGVPLTLATGTPLSQALEEVELLGLGAYFEGRIFGPVDTHDAAFSKREIIHRLLRDHGLKGSQLLAFGDGPVEISETATVGGFAVAVASDEAHPGRLDEWKRDLLLAAGAHAVIADYTSAPALLAELGL